MYENTTGEHNVAIGLKALEFNKSGSYNVSIGSGAGRYLPNTNTAVTNFSYTTTLGNDSRVSGSNQIQLGSTGTTTYAYGAVQNRSDSRDKTDVRDTLLGLTFLNTLRPVDFRWDFREEYFEEEEYTDQVTETTMVPNPVWTFGIGDDTPEFIEQQTVRDVIRTRLKEITKDGSRARTRYHHGLIAQEVKTAADGLGVDFAGYQDHSVGGGGDVLSLGYTELIGPIIKAIQELSVDKANTAYVDAAVSDLVDAAPGTLDTLNELAAALGDDANFATTVTDSLALKLEATAFNDLGTFAGATIADNVGVKVALQSLETSLETKLSAETITMTAFKAVVAASSDFADFQTRVAAL